MYSNRPRGRRSSRRPVPPSTETGTPPAASSSDFEHDEKEYASNRLQEVDPVAEPLPPPRPRFRGQRSGSSRAQSAKTPHAPALPPRGSEPWASVGANAIPVDSPARRAATAPPEGSLMAGRLPTAEVCGRVIYRGSAHGEVVVIGLFGATHPGNPLEYWVELDGPGPYVLEGVQPGRYELHACLTSGLSPNGFPTDILATGQLHQGKSVSLKAGDILENCDVELFDEVPRGLLHGIDTVFYDVADLESSVIFFRDVLGLTLTLKETSWAEFDTGNTILALRRRPQTTPYATASVRRTTMPPGGAIVVFRVENLDEIRRELVQRGVKFIGRVIEIPEARWTTFQDLDGNRMQLFERRPNP